MIGNVPQDEGKIANVMRTSITNVGKYLPNTLILPDSHHQN